MIINRENVLKHLGLLLDIRLNFVEHINVQIKIGTKGISAKRIFHLSLLHVSLLAIYKSFVWLNLDYEDVIYDQPNNSTLLDKIEFVQYNAVWAVTGAIREASREKLYQELGLESLQNRRWLRQLCSFQRILSTKLPPYLYELTPPLEWSHDNPDCLKAFQCRTELFQNSFLPYSVNNGNKLDPSVRCAKSRSLFQKKNIYIY